MQIPSLPPPLITNPLPQDIAAKAVPNVQAMAPLVARAVNPPPKSEKSNQNRSSKDNPKQDQSRGNHEEGAKDADERGRNVNIDV